MANLDRDYVGRFRYKSTKNIGQFPPPAPPAHQQPGQRLKTFRDPSLNPPPQQPELEPEPEPEPQQPEQAKPERRVQPSREAKMKNAPGDGESLLHPDIAYGVLPDGRKIPVYGPYDAKLPKKFLYITQMAYEGITRFPDYVRCHCGPACVDKCTCSAFNGPDHPYELDGRLNGQWPVIFECKPCDCDETCINRSSQREDIDFQLFHVEGMGFGVRSTKRIAVGTCVAEYLGTMMPLENLTRSSDYSFNIPCLARLGKAFKHGNYRGLEGIRLALEEQTDQLGARAFVTDAEKAGNIARFFNHSCAPNLFSQAVAYPSTQMSLSVKQARIVFFASKDIDEGEEITLDYCSNGNFGIPCKCRATNCRKII